MYVKISMLSYNINELLAGSQCQKQIRNGYGSFSRILGVRGIIPQSNYYVSNGILNVYQMYVPALGARNDSEMKRRRKAATKNIETKKIMKYGENRHQSCEDIEEEWRGKKSSWNILCKYQIINLLNLEEKAAKWK